MNYLNACTLIFENFISRLIPLLAMVIRMNAITLKAPTPPIVSVIDWAVKDPENAAKVGVGLIILGGALLILAAIFSS